MESETRNIVIGAAAGLAALAGAAAAAAHFVRRYRRRQEIFIKFKTMQGSVLVYTIRDDDGNLVRVMDVDGAYESATYLDDDMCYELVFDYHRFYNHVFDPGLPVRSMLMLGGGGFAYPKYVVSHHPDIQMDVVEIDPMVISIAQRYFFLDRLAEEFDTDLTGKLQVICGDAREYLDAPERRYDAIFNDCFVGRSPVMSLASVEGAQAIKRCLEPGGVYMSNVISALEGEKSRFLSSVVRTLGEVFEHVYVIPGNAVADNMRVGAGEGEAPRDNNVVVATDGPQPYEGVVDFVPLPDAEVFHDDLGQMYERLFRVEDE